MVVIDMQLMIFLGATIATLVAGMNAELIGRQLRILDHPDGNEGRRHHTRITPLTGGLMIVLPSLFVLGTTWLETGSSDLIGIMLAAGTFFLIGFLDDVRGLTPLTRLVIGVVVILSVNYGFPGLNLEQLTFASFNWSSDLGWVAAPLTAICVIAMANATNMADGKNGIVLGMSLIWTALLAVGGLPELWPVLFFLAISIVITLFFNLRGLLFLGDSGSLALGAFFGYLAILTYNSAAGAIPAESILLWFWVPIIDVVRLFIQRIKMGRSPMDGDREHLHHLIYARMKPAAGLTFYLSLIAVPNAIAVMYPEWALGLLIATTLFYVALCRYAYSYISRRQEAA